jgi:hypothetical protein
VKLADNGEMMSLPLSSATNGVLFFALLNVKRFVKSAVPV